MPLPDQLTAAEFERLKAQEQRMLNSGSWVPQAENVYAANLNESAARESAPDTMSAEQADAAASQQSVAAETPFGRRVGAEPDYSSTPAVNPADSEPKTIDELRRRQKDVYHDPAYDMPFDEWQEYTKWDRENSGAVEGFLEGLSGAPQALGQLGFNLAKERGRQYRRVMSGDPMGALDTEVATFKEMGRKVGVGLTQFVDWVGGKTNDMVASGRRVGQKQAQIVAALREDGKLTGDPMQDNDTIRAAMEEAASQGMFNDSQNEQTDDEQTQYQRYLRQKQYDRDYAGISEYSLGGNSVTLPGVKQSFANPITGNVAQPQEATATAASMVFDPINAVPIGAGALSKVRILRRLASVTGTPLKYAEQLGASADSWLMRQGDKITSKIPLVGDLPLGQRAAVLAGAAGVGAYVDSKTDGGLSLVTTPLMVAGGILPVMKASGTVLRKTGASGGAGWQIIKEMDAGGIGAARAATAERMASSGAFGQFSQYMRPGASGVESSLRRVSMNPDAPETLRRVARSADNIGITQVARAADDLVSSSLVAGATALPFALVAPDEETAGQIVGGAMTLGGAIGTAGRFLGRRSARADADISRMLVDVEMAGGDAKSLLSLDYASLDWLSAQQGMTQGKVDVIPLRAQEYRANVDIKNSGAETVAGLHLDRTADGRAKIYVNMGHTAPISGRVSIKEVDIARNGKTEKASVVRIKGEDGKSDFTVVPKEYPLLVKGGDVVGENTHLARGLSPRRIMPHEIGHAILTSNILDGAIRDDMRNLVNQQYGTDGIEARGREYVTRLVDRDIMAGAHDALPDKLTQREFDDIAAGKATMADVVKGKPLNDAERTRLISERMEEMRDQSRSAGNNPDGLDVFRDEVVAETFSSLSESIDFRKMRTGGPRVMESIYNGMTRMFETLGLNFDQSTGKLLDNPSVIFRDNPLTKDPVMRKRLQEHVRNYEALMVNMEQAGQRKQRGTAVSSDGTAESARRSTHTKLRPNDNGILENDIIFIDQNGNAQWKPQNMLDEQERGRASQVMFLYEKDKILPANSKEFGRRRAADGRILISGPTLPAKFDALRWFPRWLRPNKSTGDIGLARALEASRDEGMSYIFDVNVIGSGESGRYRVKNRGDIRAVIREGAFIGWQATKNHHLNAVVLDLNAFRSSAMKAINNGKLGVFNNDMTQLQADLMQYMSNHKNGLPGEAGIGIEKRDLLNGLIGTGTAVQRAANPLYADLNPRGSIRTFRVDRLNDAQPTGRTGYHIDYDKINNNRMPQQIPREAQGMPDVAVVPERFTGTGQEPNRQSRFAQPPPFFARYPIESYERGGKFFDAQSGEDLTGRSYGSGFIDVSSGKPRLFVDGDPAAQPAKSGRTYRTNLFKQKAGWKWISDNAPATSTIVSVEGGGRHVYALRADFEGGVDLARYSDKPSEPRLRPTARGELSLGNEVGRISIRGKEHPVYDGARIAQQEAPRAQGMPDVADSGRGDGMPDGDYMAAVQRGDENAARKIMEDAIKPSLFFEHVTKGKVRPFWHHKRTAEDFTTFRTPAWFSKNKEYVQELKGPINYKPSDLEASRPYFLTPDIVDKGPFKDHRVLSIDGVDLSRTAWKGKTWEEKLPFIELPDRDQVYPFHDWQYGEGVLEQPGVMDAIKEQGYQIIHIKERGFDTYAVLDSSIIKPADAVLRDEAGNVIPPSQRFGRPSAAPRGQAMPDVSDGLPRRDMQSRGKTDISNDGTVTYSGKEPKDWSPQDFAGFGKDFGVRNLGPLSKVTTITDSVGRTLADIPGGIEGKFTYYDLLWLKANPVDVGALPLELHGKLTAKLARTMTPERGNDVQKFNGILFGMLSPNSPLLPNEFGQARMRFGSMDEIKKFAGLLPDNPTKEQRKSVNQRLKKELGFTSAKSGGLGIGISVDLSNIVMAAKLFVKKPDFFIKKPNESWANFVDKLTTQVSGLGTKTASFGGVWQDPLMAGISAMDRHMARAFSEELIKNPDVRGRFEGIVVKRFNDLVEKSKKTAKKEDAKIRRAKTEAAKAKAIDAKTEAMENLPDPLSLKADTLDDVLGQAEVFGADRIKNFVNEAVFAAMGSRKAKYTVKGGAINPNLPESLQGVEWVEAPKDFQVMSDAYRSALEINAQQAKKIGIEIFPSQWTLWDRIRGRVEPHEAMFPGLERLPALNDRQLGAAYAANKQAGYARNVKAGQEWKRKSGLSPSSLAYFTPAVLAAGAALSQEEQ